MVAAMPLLTVKDGKEKVDDQWRKSLGSSMRSAAEYYVAVHMSNGEATALFTLNVAVREIGSTNITKFGVSVSKRKVTQTVTDYKTVEIL